MSTVEQPLPWFRSLFEEIEKNYYLCDEPSVASLAEMSEAWFAKWEERAYAWFLDLSVRTGDPIPAVSQEELWELYAFSRVNQALLRAFQPARPGQDNWAPEVTVSEYRAFMLRLGMDIVTTDSFSPFFHEIVCVEQDSDDDAPPVILQELWPTVMLGKLLISRAGVIVSAGRHHLRKDIAETSTLYWEYTRRNREVDDLSKGWGSNSQWRTDFRRDYLFEGYYHFNVDGIAVTTAMHPYDIADIDGGFLAEPVRSPGREQRVEMLTHRCFVTTEITEEQFPFSDVLRAPVAEGLVVTRDNGQRVWNVAIPSVAIDDVPPWEPPVADKRAETHRVGKEHLTKDGFLAQLKSLWPWQ